MKKENRWKKRKGRFNRAQGMRKKNFSHVKYLGNKANWPKLLVFSFSSRPFTFASKQKYIKDTHLLYHSLLLCRKICKTSGLELVIQVKSGNST